MDKVLFVGVGNLGSLFVKKVNEELEKIKIENRPQVKSVCFVPTTQGMEKNEPKIPCYGLNDMAAKHDNGYTSRRSAEEYREVTDDLKKDIRTILRQYLETRRLSKEH